MPGSQKPAMGAQSTFGWLQEVISTLLSRQAAIASQSTQFFKDGYGNVTALTGLLNQTVTEGAAWNAVSGPPSIYPGVEVSTGLTGSGIAVCQTFLTTGATHSNTSVTVTSATGFANGMPVAGPGIQPGTTYTISGTTLTLSLPATATASGVPITTWSFVNLAA